MIHMSGTHAFSLFPFFHALNLGTDILPPNSSI